MSLCYEYRAGIASTYGKAIADISRQQPKKKPDPSVKPVRKEKTNV